MPDLVLVVINHFQLSLQTYEARELKLVNNFLLGISV